MSTPAPSEPAKSPGHRPKSTKISVIGSSNIPTSAGGDVDLAVTNVKIELAIASLGDTHTPSYTPATNFHPNGAAAEVATEARAKRLAFIQALARQAARELATKALAAHHE